MGNSGSVERPRGARELPEQFVTQSHSDWKTAMQGVMEGRPTITKTVILPEGVTLNDPRLKVGVVTFEKKRVIEGDEVKKVWEMEGPFEADMDATLIAKDGNLPRLHTHFAVYPDECFSDLGCGNCLLHKAANPELHEGPGPVGEETVTGLTDEERAAAKIF